MFHLDISVYGYFQSSPGRSHRKNPTDFVGINPAGNDLNE